MLHWVIVDVVQCREVVTLTSHDSVGTTEPDLAALHVVLFVDLERCSTVKLSLGFGECFDFGDFDEDVVVVWENDPCGDFE